MKSLKARRTATDKFIGQETYLLWDQSLQYQQLIDIHVYGGMSYVSNEAYNLIHC